MSIKNIKKIQPLPNPFAGSNAHISKCSTFPNIFQYNDRSKQIHSQQQSQIQHYEPKNCSPTKIQQLIPSVQNIDKQQNAVINMEKCGILDLKLQSVSVKNILPLSQASQSSLIQQLQQHKMLQQSEVKQFTIKQKKRKSIFDRQSKYNTEQKSLKPKHLHIFKKHIEIKQQQKQQQRKQCPHIMCMMKSLDIIDKLTSKNMVENSNDCDIKQRIMLLRIEIDRLDNFSLQQLLAQDSKYRTTLKLQQNIFQFLRSIQNYKVQQQQTLKLSKQLCNDTNLIAIIKDKYQSIKIKLKLLAELISTILNASKEIKYQMLKKIQQQIQQLEQYEELRGSSLRLQRLLRDYCHNQRKLLLETYDWLLLLIKDQMV